MAKNDSILYLVVVHATRRFMILSESLYKTRIYDKTLRIFSLSEFESIAHALYLPDNWRERVSKEGIGVALDQANILIREMPPHEQCEIAQEES